MKCRDCKYVDLVDGYAVERSHGKEPFCNRLELFITGVKIDSTIDEFFCAAHELKDTLQEARMTVTNLKGLEDVLLARKNEFENEASGVFDWDIYGSADDPPKMHLVGSVAGGTAKDALKQYCKDMGLHEVNP